MRGLLAALSRALWPGALAPAVIVLLVASLASIEPAPGVNWAPPVLVARQAAIPPAIAQPDLQDLAILAEPDPLEIAAELQAPAQFVAVLPMPRPRPQTIDQAPPALLAEASRWIGARARDLGVRADLWCAAAINKMLANIGRKGTGTDWAGDFAHYGRRLAAPKPGAIAVKHRRGGNHVVVVDRVLPGGELLAISPNAGSDGGRGGSRVRLMRYPAAAFYAFVEPRA